MKTWNRLRPWIMRRGLLTLPALWLLAMAFGLGVGLGATFGRHWDSGSVAEWVAGIATSVAVAFALWQWIVDRRTSKSREERAQAEQVAVWMDISRRPPDTGRQGGDAYVRVRNPSQAAIYNVVVWDLTEFDANGEWQCDPQLDVDHLAWRPSVAPGWTEEITICLASMVWEQPWLGVAFTDSGGRHWIRQGAELDRLDEDPIVHFPQIQLA